MDGIDGVIFVTLSKPPGSPFRYALWYDSFITCRMNWQVSKPY